MRGFVMIAMAVGALAASARAQLVAHDLRIPPVPGRHVLIDAHGAVKLARTDDAPGTTRKHSFRFVDRWIATNATRRKLERYVIRCQVNDARGAVRDPELEGATILMAEAGAIRTTALADGRTARGPILDGYARHLDGGAALIALPKRVARATSVDVDLRPLLPLLLDLRALPPRAIARLELRRVVKGRAAELSGPIGFSTSSPAMSYDGDCTVHLDLERRAVTSLSIVGHVTTSNRTGTFSCALSTRTGQPATAALRERPQHRLVTHRYHGLTVDLESHWYLAEANAQHALFVSTARGGDVERRLMLATIDCKDAREEIKATIRASRADDEDLTIKRVRTRVGAGHSLRQRHDDHLVVHDLLAGRGRMIRIGLTCPWKHRAGGLGDLATVRKSLRVAR